MPVAKRSLAHIPTENVEQTKLATWMTNRGIKYYAIPNGGYRRPTEARRLKAEGVQSGVPDICVPIPSGQYHGLYLEIKRTKGGKLSENQIYWLAFLREKNYYAECAHGFDEAKEIVTRYLALNKPAA